MAHYSKLTTVPVLLFSSSFFLCSCVFAEGQEKPPLSYSAESVEQLRSRLTPLQYEVTQHKATEPPFDNAYWANQTEGLYVDIISGEPLFSSRDKFDSGSGWPSFSKPLNAASIETRSDKSHGLTRIEVRSKKANSHLGHLFADGPAPSGQRYCINSAALRFIPKEKMKEEGYEHLLQLFDEASP